MPVSPHLHLKLRETLGTEAADEFVNMLHSMDANMGDLRELRHEMQLGFARIDARFAQMESMWSERLDKVEARMEALLQKGLKDQTRFFFLAWSVLLAAIVGLYAR